jgi:hypothetical protein
LFAPSAVDFRKSAGKQPFLHNKSQITNNQSQITNSFRIYARPDRSKNYQYSRSLACSTGIGGTKCTTIGYLLLVNGYWLLIPEQYHC